MALSIDIIANTGPTRIQEVHTKYRQKSDVCIGIFDGNHEKVITYFSKMVRLRLCFTCTKVFGLNVLD